MISILNTSAAFIGYVYEKRQGWILGGYDRQTPKLPLRVHLISSLNPWEQTMMRHYALVLLCFMAKGY